MINILHEVQGTQVVTHPSGEMIASEKEDMGTLLRILRIQMGQNMIVGMKGVTKPMRGIHMEGMEIEEDPGDLVEEEDQWDTQDLQDPEDILDHRDPKDCLEEIR